MSRKTIDKAHQEEEKANFEKAGDQWKKSALEALKEGNKQRGVIYYRKRWALHLQKERIYWPRCKKRWSIIRWPNTSSRVGTVPIAVQNTPSKIQNIFPSELLLES